jgi:transcriptional regulator with XRE-family HTH domain
MAAPRRYRQLYLILTLLVWASIIIAKSIIIANLQKVNENCPFRETQGKGAALGRRRISETDRAFRAEVARKLREVTRTRGLSQTEAAHQLGITRQAFSQYVLEKSTPQGTILARACAKWGIVLRFRDTEFSAGAFGAQETKTGPEVLQMDLFREPQVFENRHLVVTLERSKKATLQVTIRMKQASLPVPPTRRAVGR